MNHLELFFLKNNDPYKLGEKVFYIGIFFLLSSLALGILFLLPALIFGTYFKIKQKNFFKDFWNISFLFCGIIISLNAIIQNFFLPNNYSDIWNANLSLLGITNWLPYFWLFWAVQPYLNTSPKRKTFSIILISSTLPLIVSGFGQYFFNWNGPFEAFNGLIIWYQKPINFPEGLSGLFSNQNYAGSWLNFVWPLCIALFLEKSQNILKKSISLSFLVSVGFAAFLTNSRNAWGGLLISIPLVIGQEGLIFFIKILIFILLIKIFSLIPSLQTEINNIIQSIIPENASLKISTKGYEGLDVTRLGILKSAIEIANIRPFIGIGASSFSAIYLFESGFWKGHSHNIITELAISYGIPVAIILSLTITILLILSAKYIFFQSKIEINYLYFEKAFWAAAFFFCLSQLFDIQYFDGKIGLTSWMFFAGLKCIIDNYKKDLCRTD